MSNREFTAQRTMLANAMATAGAELLSYMGVSSALAAIPNTEPPQYVVAGTLAMIAKVLPTAPVPPLTAPAPLTDDLPEDIVHMLREYAANPGYSHNDYADTMQQAAHCIESLRAMFYNYAIAPAPQQSELTDERIKEVIRQANLNGEIIWVGFEKDGEGRYTVPELTPMERKLCRLIEREVLAAKAAPAAPVQTEVPSEVAEMVRTAMKRAYNLGQTYWQQADSEYTSQHKKADVTAGRFIELTDETCAKVESSVAAPVQAEPVDQGHVLRTLRRLIDGSQPQDISGAVMVIDNALKNGIAWSYDIAPPQGFVAYVKANYTGDVHFHDPEWHATRLWNAAMKNAGSRIALPAQAEQAVAVRAAALEEVAKLIEKKVEAYDQEHGCYDHTTGVTEYPGDGGEWVCEMGELAEEIRALAAPSTSTSNDTGALGEKGVEA